MYRLAPLHTSHLGWHFAYLLHATYAKHLVHTLTEPPTPGALGTSVGKRSLSINRCSISAQHTEIQGLRFVQSKDNISSFEMVCRKNGMFQKCTTPFKYYDIRLCLCCHLHYFPLDNWPSGGSGLQCTRARLNSCQKCLGLLTPLRCERCLFMKIFNHHRSFHVFL